VINPDIQDSMFKTSNYLNSKDSDSASNYLNNNMVDNDEAKNQKERNAV